MKTNFKKSFSLTTAITSLSLVVALLSVNSCGKEKTPPNNPHDHCGNTAANTTTANGGSQMPVQNQPLVKVMTVANIRLLANENINQVMFCENAQVFAVYNNDVLNELRTAFSNHTKVKVAFDPWNAEVISVKQPSPNEITATHAVLSKGTAVKFDVMPSDDELDSRFGAVNVTAGNLVNVIPDIATAQLMFNYLTTQCCAIPGPYTVDYCISFQYAHDGCYARAHKMCDIINNRYHYQTQKVFSFANAGSDVLCVQAQKWGGCCVNWWYHVVPLVSVKTPTGVKAYAFDPAMFDQPVLLSAWLHAQENPACAAGVPNVSMINVQPTAMYAPSDGTGYAFMTDPGYSDTNYTLSAYAALLTCP